MYRAQTARWFGYPFNAWHVGTIKEINRRRTVSENISVEFHSTEEGETRGLFVADADTYGTHKLWVLVRPIPVTLDDSNDGSGSSPDEDSDD